METQEKTGKMTLQEHSHLLPKKGGGKCAEIEDVFVAGRVAILCELSTVEGLTVNELSKRTGLSYNAVLGHLRILELTEIVWRKHLGKVRLICFNEDSARAMKLRQFIVAYQQIK